MTFHDRGVAVADSVRRFLNKNLGPLILIAALVGPAWVTSSFERQRLQVVCDTYHLGVAAYMRDRAIAIELGIPIRFSPPVSPEECRET